MQPRKQYKVTMDSAPGWFVELLLPLNRSSVVAKMFCLKPPEKVERCVTRDNDLVLFLLKKFFI